MTTLGQQGARTPAKTAAKTPVPTASDATKPGRKPGQKAKEYDFSALSVDLLASPAAVPAQVGAAAAPARVRDERQQAMDKVVKQLHNDWIAADRPAAWSAQPKTMYAVDPKAVEGLKYLIDRAGSYHGVAIRYGKPVRDQNGRELVVFAVKDRRPRKQGDEAGSEG